MTTARLALCALVIFWLAGCATTPRHGTGSSGSQHTPRDVDLDNIPPAIPKDEPLSKYGNPVSYTVLGKTYRPLKSANGFVQIGVASWYGQKFHGQRTSSGEPYDMYRMTAAHKTLPIPSYVRVTNLRNDRHVIVRVNDRGPFHDNRIIDLSYVAALKLGVVKTGTAPVLVETVTAADTNKQPHDSLHKTAYHDQSAAAEPEDVPLTPIVPRSYDDSTSQHHPTATTKPSRSGTQHRAKTTPTVATGKSRKQTRRHAAQPNAQRLYLQVGAFVHDSNAQKMVSRLNTLSIHNVRVEPIQSRGKTLYHVRVGPFAGADARAAMRTVLSSHGIAAIRVAN